MAIGANVGVWGAPSERDVAIVLRDALGGVLEPGIGGGWIQTHDDWVLVICESAEVGIAPVIAGTDNRSIRGSTDDLWVLLNRMFDSLAAATAWGLHASSDHPDSFPTRFRAGGGVTSPLF